MWIELARTAARTHASGATPTGGAQATRKICVRARYAPVTMSAARWGIGDPKETVHAQTDTLMMMSDQTAQ